MTKRHRSAVTGEYVTAEQAKADPERTVSERVAGQMDAVELMRAIDAALDDVIGKRAPDMMRPLREANERKAREKAELLARIEVLEAAVAALQAKP